MTLLRRAIALSALGLASASTAIANQTCAPQPYSEATGALADLSDRLDKTLAAFPSLARALEEQATQLAASAGSDSAALAALQSVRARIQDLKSVVLRAVDPKK